MTTRIQPRADDVPGGHFHRVLGLLDASALVAGSMVGSGIFIVSAAMMRDLGSVGWLLAVWALAGAMTVSAAWLYGGLAARLPRAGGQYVYLREAFGPLIGFLYGWTLFLVIQTGTIAAVAVAFARFAAVLVPAIGAPAVGPGISGERLIAIALIASLTAANCRHVELGRKIQNTFTAAKLAALVLVILACIALGPAGVLAANFAAMWSRAPESLPLVAAVGSAIVGALFSADAWNNVGFASEEVRDPTRTVPRAMLIGTIAVMTLYLAVNVGYLSVLPALGVPTGTTPIERGVAYATADRVATAAMDVALGGAGVLFVALAIMVSTFGCVNGMVLAGARAVYAMARDGLFFAWSARLNRAGVPAGALVAQGIWAAALTLSGTYGDLLDYVIFAALLFYALTVAATFRLGAAESLIARVVAVAYITTASALMLVLLVVKPRFTWPGLAIVVAGIPVYFLWRRSSPRTSP